MTPSSQSYHHGDLRSAILVEARKLLEERGPNALNLREIARRLKVSAPSAYHHFDNLEAIALALAEEGFAELARKLEVAPTNARGQLAPAGEAYVAFARANPGLYRLMFGEGIQPSSAEGRALRNLREQVYATVRTGLQKRLPENKIDDAALFLWSLVHGLSLLIVDGRAGSAPDCEALIRRVLLMSGTGIPTSA